MAYHESVPVIEGDIAVVQATQSSLECSDSPRVFQFNNQEPHVVAAVNMASATGNVTANSIAYSPDGKYLVWAIAKRVIIYNLDTGVITDTSTGVTLGTPCFTGDSTTVLFSTTSSPFLISVDLSTGSTKGTISGTYTFISGNARGCGYKSRCYLISIGQGTGSYSIYEYEATTNSITTLDTTGYQYGSIACSVSGQFLVAMHGSSTTTGPLTYIYDLENLATAPYTNGSTDFRGQSGMSDICKYGSSSNDFMLCIAKNTTTLRLVKIVKNAVLANYTMTTVTASGPGIPGSNVRINAIDGFGFVYPGLYATYPAYRALNPVCYIDLRAYVSGAVTAKDLPGINEKYQGVAVSPRFAVRRLAGIVKNQSGAGVARKVVVINRRTMRMIANITSNSDGTFTIPIYNGEQCIVMAVGTGTYSSKLVDYVAPVV